MKMPDFVDVNGKMGVPSIKWGIFVDEVRDIYMAEFKDVISILIHLRHA